MPVAEESFLVDLVDGAEPTSWESKLSRRSFASCLVSSEMLGLLMVALRPPATRLGFLSIDNVRNGSKIWNIFRLTSRRHGKLLSALVS